jgi:hypothetical protein
MTPPPTPDEMRLDAIRRRAEYVSEVTGITTSAHKVASVDIPWLLEQVAALSTTAARYREVLEPFAKIVALYETCDDDWPIDGRWSFNHPVVTVGDLRRAAAILAQTTPCDGCVKGMPLVSTAKRRLHDRGDGTAAECTHPPAAPAEEE